MLKVLVPVQESEVDEAALAPRLDGLDGKVLGLYSNTKLNADRLLELIAQELEPLGDFTIRHGVYHADKEMTEEEWGDVAKCDLVILANGDCGACSSSGLANAIALERKGVPAFLISTPPFVEALGMMARLKGMPDIGWAVVDHPIGSIDEAALQVRARDAAAQFRATMLTGHADDGPMTLEAAE